MKRIALIVIFLLQLMILFPILVIIYLLPVALTAGLIGIMFDDESFLPTIVAMGLWGWIYFKTTTGAKLMDIQEEMGETVGSLFVDPDF
jgi:ABC-type dipeptide/oligopeptide/nickel transport system permease subunit|tara:strand:+ start:238 stop:504 length:267 start_codon:yes stop_codon:yes gene_type:complete